MVQTGYSAIDLSAAHIEAMTKKDDDLINAWILSQEVQGLSMRTTQRRLVALRSFRRFLHPLTLSQASPAVCEDWLAGIPGLATRHAYRSDLGIMYKWAVRRRLLHLNPFEDLPSTRVPKGTPRPFTPEQIRRLLTVDLDRTYALMIRLGLYAGLRISEIAGLSWEDVRFGESPTLTVRNGKGGKGRVVPIHPELAGLLSPAKPYGLILTTPEGTAFDAARVGRSIKAVFMLLGIDGVPHQLRHSYATELARASGGDMLLVATLLGHANPATSMIYAQLAGGEANRVVELMWAA